MMNELYQLATAFYRTHLWETVSWNEWFAVDLGEDTGYCQLASVNDGTVLLEIFPGSEGLSSFRNSIRLDSPGSNVITELDALHCYLFPKGVLDKADEEKAMNMFPGIKAGDCVPVCCRLRPYTLPVIAESGPDIENLVSALKVLIGLSDLLKTGKQTKADLGFRRMILLPGCRLIQESDEPKIVPDTEKTTVPLLLESKSGVRVGQVELPPYEERIHNPPSRLDNPVFTRLLEQEKKGEYEVDLVHHPGLQEGDPPFFPEALAYCDRNRSEHLYTLCANRTHIAETDSLLVAFVDHLLKEKIHPASIRYRNPDVKTMLKPLCDRVGIKMRKVKYLDEMDFALEDLREKAEPKNAKLIEKSFAAKLVFSDIGGSADGMEEGEDLVSRIPELETAPVAELCLWNAEALIDLLIHHHKELSPFLIRKLYRVLS